MIEYDVTLGGPQPHIALKPNERLIRCIYDHNGLISYLIGAHLSDGVHLFLGARPDVSIETTTNPIHHHITILTNNSAEYAKVFNTKRFVVEYKREGKETFLQQRFPTWSFVGYSINNFPVIELIIP